MKKSFNQKGLSQILAIVIIVIIVIALAGIGYYLFTQTEEETNVDLIPIKTNKNTNAINTNQAIDTSDWQTYTDSLVRYSVKYPNLWKTEMCGVNAELFTETSNIICDSDRIGTFLIYVSEYANIEDSIAYSKTILTDPIETSISIGSVKAQRLTGVVKKGEEYMKGGGWYEDKIYAQNDKYIYIITYTDWKNNNLLKQNIFNNFISTFQFLSDTSD